MKNRFAITLNSQDDLFISADLDGTEHDLLGKLTKRVHERHHNLDGTATVIRAFKVDTSDAKHSNRTAPLEQNRLSQPSLHRNDDGEGHKLQPNMEESPLCAHSGMLWLLRQYLSVVSKRPVSE